MDTLANDISEIHKINLTSLTEDFHKLTQAINVSEIDVASLQTELTQIQAIADITSFNPLKVDIKTIPTISTATTVMMWVILAIIVIVISFGCYLCLPTYFVKAVLSFFALICRLIFNSFRYIFTTCRKAYFTPAQTETDPYFRNNCQNYPNIFEGAENISFQSLRNNTQNISPPPTYNHLLKIVTDEPTLSASCLSPVQNTQIVYSENFLNHKYDLHVSHDRVYVCTEILNRNTNTKVKIYFHILKNQMIDGQYNIHNTVPTPPPEIVRKLQTYWSQLPNQHVLKENNAIRLYANPRILYDTDKLVFARYSDQNTLQSYIFGLKYVPF